MYGPVISDSVRPVVDAGMVDFVDDYYSLCKEVSLSPTPGHTPGHVSVLINSKKKRALITGDFIHHPVQMTNTDWCSPGAESRAVVETRATRLLVAPQSPRVASLWPLGVLDTLQVLPVPSCVIMNGMLLPKPCLLYTSPSPRD